MTDFPRERTLDEIRDTILVMPFAQAMQIELEFAEDGVGVASMPLNETVAYNGSAFAGLAIGIIGDVAAGAATLAMTPHDQMALTGAVNSVVTASTEGSRLTARAELRERSETALIYDAVVKVHPHAGEPTECGTVVVSIHVPRPRR